MRTITTTTAESEATAMKALVILNPPAGASDRQAVLHALRRHFEAAAGEYEVYETRVGDSLADLVRRRLRDGWDLVVAAGGDGTVSAVGDGLVGSSIPLGIVPIGTGNQIARELELPADMDAAVELIAGAPRVRRIDAMRIGGRLFLLNASVGISASVIGGTTRRNKGRFGRLAYYATALLKVVSSRPRYLVVEVDGIAHPYRAGEVSVMNCGRLARRLYPGGAAIRIDDGHLGVWILSMRTVWDYLRYVIGLATGRIGNPDVHFISAARSVGIRSRVPLLVQADGDIIATTPVEVVVLPGALTVLVAGAAGAAGGTARAMAPALG